MQYTVIGPGGQNFGPADVATLNAWAAQGRLAPATELIRSDGMRMTAMMVPGLAFPGGQPFAQATPGFGGAQNYGSGPGTPYPGPYGHGVPPSPTPAGGGRGGGLFGYMFSTEIGIAWACAFIGFFCVPLVPPIIGMVIAFCQLKTERNPAIGALIANSLIFLLHAVGAFCMMLIFSKG